MNPGQVGHQLPLCGLGRAVPGGHGSVGEQGPSVERVGVVVAVDDDGERDALLVVLDGVGRSAQCVQQDSQATVGYQHLVAGRAVHPGGQHHRLALGLDSLFQLAELDESGDEVIAHDQIIRFGVLTQAVIGSDGPTKDGYRLVESSEVEQSGA